MSQTSTSRSTLAFAQTTVSVGHGGGGTVGFIAPEILSGGCRELSGKSDVFSLGRTFEEVAVATGALPKKLEALEEAECSAQIKPFLRLLRTLVEASASSRPTAAEAASLAHDVLMEMDRIEAEETRRQLEEQMQRLRADQAAQEQSQATIQQREKELASLEEALQRPSYWRHAASLPASLASDGFAAVPLDQKVDSATLALLERMLETDGSELGIGKDYKWIETQPYDKLKLSRAWRIQNTPLWDKYASGRQSVVAGVKRIADSGKTVRPSGCRLHEIAAQMPGGLKEGANEEMLLHGTSVDLVNEILSTGLNEHFSGLSSGTAFGDGIYFADDGNPSTSLDRMQPCFPTKLAKSRIDLPLSPQWVSATTT